MPIFNTIQNAMKESSAVSLQYARVAGSLSAKRAHVYIPTIFTQDDYVQAFLNNAAATAAADRIKSAIIADDDSVDGDDVAILVDIGATHVVFGEVEAITESSLRGEGEDVVTRIVETDHSFIALADL